ncbi:uncharacterized protein L969DRAFT_53775 [Mixia osmundae IAM 14324]|uniref:NADPH-dependent FMN reductase-like domain-containing protein n=1 Tax=Mixia osmundae (strain CBS 9802 / IAM 14324 / JCM 22182 / KY 12970) TaxID=764103 RepID=G7E0D7_MIXOS|nr:uncharacterized protein L969DRAFT_53775 [Mixia osmundae IAM 14324]KEI37135.1 hypothetical protein L969DRAFT_53775 [Mixia osmundae IAM 14324]GAA96297.1 hypothetical protein E5Q_02963 [Mixia osmundae IAM 14324]
MHHRLGILAGSFRQNGNAAGVTRWAAARLRELVDKDTEVLILSEHATLPLPALKEQAVPATINDSSNYEFAVVQEWSRLISSLSGLIITTPQYNWGYPGDLKNAIDHLYMEWKDLPIVIATFGGHGGSKCGPALAQVIEGIKAKVVSVSEVEITLPKNYIGGNERVQDGQEEFLAEYGPKLDEAMTKLLDQLRERK